MVVNFRIRRINQDTRKLTRTTALIVIKKNHIIRLSLSLFPFSNKITENVTKPSSNVVKTEKKLIYV